MEYRLSYLMGAEQITDVELTDLGITIVRKSGHSRMLKIPEEAVTGYIELIRAELTNGFWNEIIGVNEILFIFKLSDGTIREYVLSPANEREIDKLCAELNNEPPGKTGNVYKYISENDFYHDFMLEHYADLISRP